MTWSAEGGLASISQGTALRYTNVYDAEGNLLIKRPTSNAAGTTTLYLGSTEVQVTKSAGTTPTYAKKGLRYYAFGGGTVAVRTATPTLKLSFVAADPQGTANAQWDAANPAATRSKRYTDPFGVSRTSPAWVDDKRFLGAPNDASTGLTHLGAREYDASLGQFISVDPLMDSIDPQSMNGFAYANNNPVNKSDATGLMPPPDAVGWNPPAAPSPPPTPAPTPLPPTGFYDPHTAASIDTAAAAEDLYQAEGTWMSTTVDGLPTGRTKNTIPGAHRLGHLPEFAGNNGVADVIIWTTTDIYIYEIKNVNSSGAFAMRQLQRYVEKLGDHLESLGDTRQVQAGEELGPRLTGSTAGDILVDDERMPLVYMDPDRNIHEYVAGVRWYETEEQVQNHREGGGGRTLVHYEVLTRALRPPWMPYEPSWAEKTSARGDIPATTPDDWEIPWYAQVDWVKTAATVGVCMAAAATWSTDVAPGIGQADNGVALAASARCANNTRQLASAGH